MAALPALIPSVEALKDLLELTSSPTDPKNKELEAIVNEASREAIENLLATMDSAKTSLEKERVKSKQAASEGGAETGETSSVSRVEAASSAYHEAKSEAITAISDLALKLQFNEIMRKVLVEALNQHLFSPEYALIEWVLISLLESVKRIAEHSISQRSEIKLKWLAFELEILPLLQELIAQFPKDQMSHSASPAEALGILATTRNSLSEKEANDLAVMGVQLVQLVDKIKRLHPIIKRHQLQQLTQSIGQRSQAQLKDQLVAYDKMIQRTRVFSAFFDCMVNGPTSNFVLPGSMPRYFFRGGNNQGALVGTLNPPKEEIFAYFKEAQPLLMQLLDQLSGELSFLKGHKEEQALLTEFKKASLAVLKGIGSLKVKRNFLEDRIKKVLAQTRQLQEDYLEISKRLKAKEQSFNSWLVVETFIKRLSLIDVLVSHRNSNRFIARPIYLTGLKKAIDLVSGFDEALIDEVSKGINKQEAQLLSSYGIDQKLQAFKDQLFLHSVGLKTGDGVSMLSVVNQLTEDGFSSSFISNDVYSSVVHEYVFRAQKLYQSLLNAYEEVRMTIEGSWADQEDLPEIASYFSRLFDTFIVPACSLSVHAVNLYEDQYNSHPSPLNVLLVSPDGSVNLGVIKQVYSFPDLSGESTIPIQELTDQWMTEKQPASGSQEMEAHNKAKSPAGAAEGVLLKSADSCLEYLKSDGSLSLKSITAFQVTVLTYASELKSPHSGKVRAAEEHLFGLAKVLYPPKKASTEALTLLRAEEEETSKVPRDEGEVSNLPPTPSFKEMLLKEDE